MSRRHPPPFPAQRRLALAMAASLLTHGLLLLPPAAAPRMRPSPPPRLQASLQPPPLPMVPELKLEQPAAESPPQRSLPAQARPTNPRPPLPLRQPKQPATWTEAVRQHLHELQKRGQFYPQEAIARGQQGEVLVLLLLDENGQVTAARVEQGSGYPLLDAAALQAVRSLSALPADAPRQTLLPVRFKLR